jgi:hypothetical protein
VLDIDPATVPASFLEGLDDFDRAQAHDFNRAAYPPGGPQWDPVTRTPLVLGRAAGRAAVDGRGGGDRGRFGQGGNLPTAGRALRTRGRQAGRGARAGTAPRPDTPARPRHPAAARRPGSPHPPPARGHHRSRPG